MPDFLTATDVGRLVHLWKKTAPGARRQNGIRERWEREEEREAEAEELGAAEGSGGGQELPLFLPTPSFISSAGEE